MIEPDAEPDSTGWEFKKDDTLVRDEPNQRQLVAVEQNIVAADEYTVLYRFVEAESGRRYYYIKPSKSDSSSTAFLRTKKKAESLYVTKETVHTNHPNQAAD